MASNAARVCLISSTGELAGTWGSTGVAASRKLHGVENISASIEQKVETPSLIGFYGPGPVGEEVSQSASFTIDGTWTYQEAPKILNGVFVGTSGSTSTGAGAPYDYYYNAPVNSTQVSYTYPMEIGTSTGNAYKINGAIFNGLKLSGDAGSLWKFSVPGVGKNIFALTTGMSTAANSDSRLMQAVRMADTNLRIVPFATGPFGSSSGQVTGNLISFELNVNANRHVKTFAGNMYPDSWGDGKYDATLRTVLEFTSGVTKPYIDELLGSSGGATSTGIALQRQLAIYASATDTGGTSTGLVSAIYFAGIASNPIKLWDDRDGNMTVDVTWSAKLSTALANIGTSGTGNYCSFKCVNPSSSTT